ncbi:MAG: dihydrofolate reductase family protein, partial [Chitinivibrionia bacterium]|nr:dihydrofolate reductase family protein [Chitinivibrionia bacterium]
RAASAQPINVILSNTLDIPLSKPLFRQPGTEKLVFTTRAASPERIRRAERCASVVVFPSKTVSPKRVVEYLGRRGVRRILVEGGGALNHSFIKARLVDEIYITVTPFVIGGSGAPTVVDGQGFLAHARVRLELVSCRRIKDEVFLRYRVLR